MSKDYIVTPSGRRISVLHPSEELITAEDIESGLKAQHRYSGNTRRPYSVLEHTLIVADMVSEEARPYALLHDASEAYIHDIPSPIKAVLPDYQRLEKAWMKAILRKFGVTATAAIRKEVELADYKILAYEVWELCNHPLEYDCPKPPKQPGIKFGLPVAGTLTAELNRLLKD